MNFSIVTPSYNQGRFLPDCVDSVLAQKGVTFEHIVVDAGSTDDTLSVLEAYPHLKWTSEKDDGMSDGINKGFLRAKGDLVMWLNCDDYLLPGALAKVMEFADREPGSDIIHGDCIFVDEDKSLIRRKYDTTLDEWDLLFVGCCIPSTATFYRRGIIEAGHMLDVGYHNCMDWEYYLRLTRLGFRFGYIRQALACFRWYENSTTQKHLQRMIEEGLRAQRAHIDVRGLHPALKGVFTLRLLRKIFQCRRILKRVMIHGRPW